MSKNERIAFFMITRDILDVDIREMKADILIDFYRGKTCHVLRQYTPDHTYGTGV